MSQYNLKRIIKKDGTKFGTGIFEFTTPGIGYILKQGGCDFAFIDMEHSGIGIDKIKSLLRYLEAAELPAFVRPPSDHYHDISVLLDIGAEGILLPLINNAKQAKNAISSIKYPPNGKRGVAMGLGGNLWEDTPHAEGQMRSNENIVIIMLIETKEGVSNVEEIASLDGVDALWIGHSDLSASLGIPGQFNHPDFKLAVKKVVDSAKKNGLHLGRLTQNISDTRRFIEDGYDLICFGNDVSLLRNSIKNGILNIQKNE